MHGFAHHNHKFHRLITIHSCTHTCMHRCISLQEPVIFAAIVSRIQSGSVGMNYEALRMLGSCRAVPTKESWRKLCGGATLSSEGSANGASAWDAEVQRVGAVL